MATEADLLLQMPQLADIQQQMQALMAATAGNMGGAMPPPPPADVSQPDMTQAYLQMFQYLQQMQGAGGMGGMPGMPTMPFSGLPPSPYTPAPAQDYPVAVSVEGMKFQYQLTEDDLQKVFSRYGSVKLIQVQEGGSAATITFYTQQEAQAAINDLDGKVLNGLEGTLRLSWLRGNSAPPPFPTMPFPGSFGFPPLSNPGWPPGAPTNTSPGIGNASPDSGKADSSKGVRKYTCRFIIGIENDKEFQVARRIIGSKGAHMKRIVRQTETTGSVAKLRLRGVGSGYFEGTGQKESVEPLQLCISCTSSEGYKMAVRHTEELLKRVYEEYRQFCKDHGRPVPDLQINLSESQLVYGNSARVPGAPVDMLAAPEDISSASPKKQNGKKVKQSKKSATVPNGEMDRGEPGPHAPSVQEIEKFIDERNEARRACNFAEADRIRQLLHSRGVALMDEPGGRGRGTEVTTWRYWRD